MITVMAVLAGNAFPQVSLSVLISGWGSEGIFASDDNGATGATVTAGTPAYFGFLQSGTTSMFSFSSLVPIPDKHLPTQYYDLSETVLAGQSLQLVFNVATAPKYVAITGGSLNSYSYTAGRGKLTLNVTTVNPVPSANDPAGDLLQSAFGVIIETGGTYDFGGAVFQTDMFWTNLAAMDAGFSGSAPLAGLLADGISGSAATFAAHLPLSFLTNAGITAPAEAGAIVQKADGTVYNLATGLTLFAQPGVTEDPALHGGGYTFGGESTFDFDGDDTADAYLVATYANSNWSEANIGIAAVPEPAACALIAGVVMLVCGLCRRR